MGTTNNWCLYTDANKSRKTGYKTENLSKVDLIPYDSVQNLELYAILMALSGFKEPPNITTDSQYAESELFCTLEQLSLYQD